MPDRDDLRLNRVLIVSWMGDYREAFLRLAAGGPETYYAQRYSLEKTAELGRHVEQMGQLCCNVDSDYDEVQSDGIRSMGIGLASSSGRWDRVLLQVEKFRPTHVILRTPAVQAMKWCLDHRVEVLPIFADSFAVDTKNQSRLRGMARTLRHRLRNAKLARILNENRIRWVGNHNVPASQDLVRIGVDPRKVLPWDWPPILSPDMFEPKTGVTNDDPWKLFFIGSVIETKGVGDAVEAVGELTRRGKKVELTIVGSGEIDMFSQLAAKYGVTENVHFTGKLGHDRVIELIRGSHVVLVPSHHRYTEGIPMVVYESFSTRTPVICSNHPMFVNKIDQNAATVVPQQQPSALANAVEQLLGDGERYRRMSLATQEAWNRLQCPLRYFDFIEHWLNGTPEDDAWLSQFSLASGRYTA